MSGAILKPLGLETTDISDVFSSQMRELRQMVEAGKMADAQAALNRNEKYFAQRLSDSSKPLPPEFQKLGAYVWGQQYAAQVADAISALGRTNDFLDRTKWAQQASDMEKASALRRSMNNEFSLNILRQGDTERRALSMAIGRVEALASTQRTLALALTFEDAFATGIPSTDYPTGPFKAEAYAGSAEFQALLRERMLALPTRAALVEAATRLKGLASPAVREAVDKRFAEGVRQELMADGRVSLEELSTLTGAKTPFGTSMDALTDIVRIGYVDLTSASFRNRNIFDFEVAFKQDFALSFKPADESVFKTGNLSGYDYLFVTDLAVAKVSRDFKSKKAVKSRVQTGERRESNPNYVSAMSNYQQAMVEYQRQQISSAQPKACQGIGCVLIALGDGLAQGAAKSRVDEASKALAGTSQTVTIPVYSEYDYQSVDIDATKTADVNYYVVDVRQKRVLRSNFQVNDRELFNVAYNVRDEDPDKSSILRNVKSEEEVTAWEKRPLEVRLSALFHPDSLRTATASPFTDVAGFVASLNSRPVVAASPTYGRADGAGGAKTQVALKDSGATSPSGTQTIADERFDSIVIIQSPGSTGTGFYVTPELVLTAYHVVAKNSLVQMTFYDGTKTFGKVVDHDIRLDLALVRAQQAGKPLKIHTGPLRLGETVEAIGHPKGYEFTITRGVVSAMRRQRSATIGSDNLVEFVQTDTPISPGNSGGPLLLKDTVIGVNDWIRVDKGSQNLNFSVSFNEIRSFLERNKGK